MKNACFVILSILLCFGVFHPGALSAADKYPVKPVEFIVPLEAGADGDIITRPVTQKVSQLLGQPVVIVNKPGAGSSIGYREVLRAKPDGYTLGWGSATLISNKLQGISPFDYHDFTMLGTFATYFPVIVAATNTKRPFATIQEVISHAKANPGDVSMATGGVGQNWWVAAMAFFKGTRTAGWAAIGAGVAGGITQYALTKQSKYYMMTTSGSRYDRDLLGLYAAQRQLMGANAGVEVLNGSEMGLPVAEQVSGAGAPVQLLQGGDSGVSVYQGGFGATFGTSLFHK